MLSFLLASTLFATAHAQVGVLLDPSKLPQCALQCANLNAAQAVCVPPATPASDQATYQNCFCQSGYLGTWRSGATTGVCDAECAATPDDLATAQQWYAGLCQSGTVVTPGAADAPATATDSAGTATGTATSNSAAAASGGRPKTWIQTHYQWVIMLVVLFILALASIFLGLWLKRRHDRKWATGGATRDSMLTLGDATSSLGNRHPDTPGHTAQPYPQRGSSSRGMAVVSGAKGLTKSGGMVQTREGSWFLDRDEEDAVKADITRAGQGERREPAAPRERSSRLKKDARNSKRASKVLSTG